MTKILIADDEPDALRLACIKLRKAGLEVIEATNGQEALGLALEDSPDLVLLDVMMPLMDGYTVSQKIREKMGEKAPPIIMLTAMGQQRDVSRGYESGAADYITKPFSPRELLDRVTQVLEKSPVK